MRTVNDIKLEIERATERRTELWRHLSAGHSAPEAAELARLNSRIADLWDELRTARTRQRFGSPDLIMRRADRDKRIERELDRAIERHRLTRAA
jgi:ABC-type phosphate transport system auxiliary subunit